jgi:DNA-directed RNA polymerase subunit M/transcription elongation factor TFIIS
MFARQTLGILSKPLRPSALIGKCPKCGRWFVFNRVRKEKSEISGTVSTYRCNQCGHEEQYARRHPPHAI